MKLRVPDKLYKQSGLPPGQMMGRQPETTPKSLTASQRETMMLFNFRPPNGARKEMQPLMSAAGAFLLFSPVFFSGQRVGAFVPNVRPLSWD